MGLDDGSHDPAWAEVAYSLRRCPLPIHVVLISRNIKTPLMWKANEMARRTPAP
jgi:hypothetical protein